MAYPRNQRCEQKFSRAMAAAVAERQGCRCCATLTCRSRKRICLHRRPLGLGQDDVDFIDRRTDRTGSRRNPARRQTDRRTGTRPRRDISELFVAAVDDACLKTSIWPSTRWRRRLPAEKRAAHGALHQFGQSWRGDEESAARAFRRHAPASRGGARSGDGSEGVALGRTVQRPRRADARHAARGIGAHLDGNAQDRGDDYQRHRRSDPARRHDLHANARTGATLGPAIAVDAAHPRPAQQLSGAAGLSTSAARDFQSSHCRAGDRGGRARMTSSGDSHYWHVDRGK